MIWPFLLGMVVGVIAGVFFTVLLCVSDGDEK